MKRITLNEYNETIFENIKRVDENGAEYWDASNAVKLRKI